MPLKGNGGMSRDAECREGRQADGPVRSERRFITKINITPTMKFNEYKGLDLPKVAEEVLKKWAQTDNKILFHILQTHFDISV